MENNMKGNCAQLIKGVSEASFYVTDLQLYLDTHPDDIRALEMFKEACRQLKVCCDAFENCCYPLKVCSSGKDDEWDWLIGCWPSERMV